MSEYRVVGQLYRVSSSLFLIAVGIVATYLFYGTWKNPATSFFVWMPYSIGMLGLGAWSIRRWLLYGKDADTMTGAILGAAILVATAIVIAGAL